MFNPFIVLSNSAAYDCSEILFPLELYNLVILLKVTCKNINNITVNYIRTIKEYSYYTGFTHLELLQINF